eukprot:Hpha_TRINITY_DN4680_c0_g1::TRINITY_DN4680_c0_g1_i1::g.97076::m.97076/K04794/PTH2; peptidyl-tRNA hydrolase, PTH2 family
MWEWDILLFPQILSLAAAFVVSVRAVRGGFSRRRATPEEMSLKMVLIVRKDLKMGTGKIAAQCCHAAVGAVERVLTCGGVLKGRYRPSNGDHDWFEWYCSWRKHGCAKVAVKLEDTAGEPELVALRDAAEKEGLPTYVVSDAGRTQIAAGSKTVLAVGPAPKSRVDKITSTLKLL